MTSHYSISDIKYIIWEMPIALVFRLLVNYRVQATGGKKMNTAQENEQITDLIKGFGELRDAQNKA